MPRGRRIPTWIAGTSHTAKRRAAALLRELRRDPTAAQREPLASFLSAVGKHAEELFGQRQGFVLLELLFYWPGALVAQPWVAEALRQLFQERYFLAFDPFLHARSSPPRKERARPSTVLGLADLPPSLRKLTAPQKEELLALSNGSRPYSVAAPACERSHARLFELLAQHAVEETERGRPGFLLALLDLFPHYLSEEGRRLHPQIVPALVRALERDFLGAAKALRARLPRKVPSGIAPMTAALVASASQEVVSFDRADPDLLGRGRIRYVTLGGLPALLDRLPQECSALIGENLTPARQERVIALHFDVSDRLAGATLLRPHREAIDLVAGARRKEDRLRGEEPYDRKTQARRRRVQKRLERARGNGKR